MPTTVITGASEGLGLALARHLARREHRLVIDARHPEPLAAVAQELRRYTTVIDVAGDVGDPAHRAALVEKAGDELHLLVHNASTLGPTPLRSLSGIGADDLAAVLAVNVVAPQALTRACLPALRRGRGTVLAISSDAAVEHYPTWGAYAASKAALDHLMGTWAAEEPELGWYAVDPGDMRTTMHAAAFPGEDISDRPLPETVLPALDRLLRWRPANGRYRAADIPTVVAEVAS